MIRRLSLLLLCAGCCFGIVILTLDLPPALSQKNEFGNTIELKIPFDPKEFIAPSLPGKVNTFSTRLNCYDAFTGEPIRCFFTQTLFGLQPPPPDPFPSRCDPDLNDCFPGGHEHDYANHPAGVLTFLPGFNRVPQQVAGFTLKETRPVTVTHELPDVSGNLQLETLI